MKCKYCNSKNISWIREASRVSYGFFYCDDCGKITCPKPKGKNE